MMSRASGLMTRSPNMTCLIGPQYWLSAGSGSAFSLADAGMDASKARMPADNRRKPDFFILIPIPPRMIREVYPSPGARIFPRCLFPFQLRVGRRHIAPMEQVESRPVARFGQADFVGRLLDGLAIADGGAGFIQDDREITLLRVQRLRPVQVAATMAGHVVIRRNGAQILNDPKEAGDGAVGHRRGPYEQQIGQPQRTGRCVEYGQVVVGMRRRPGLHD